MRQMCRKVFQHIEKDLHGITLEMFNVSFCVSQVLPRVSQVLPRRERQRCLAIVSKKCVQLGLLCLEAIAWKRLPECAHCRPRAGASRESACSAVRCALLSFAFRNQLATATLAYVLPPAMRHSPVAQCRTPAPLFSPRLGRILAGISGRKLRGVSVFPRAALWVWEFRSGRGAAAVQAA